MSDIDLYCHVRRYKAELNHYELIDKNLFTYLEMSLGRNSPDQPTVCNERITDYRPDI